MTTPFNNMLDPRLARLGLVNTNSNPSLGALADGQEYMHYGIFDQFRPGLSPAAQANNDAAQRAIDAVNGIRTGKIDQGGNAWEDPAQWAAAQGTPLVGTPRAGGAQSGWPVYDSPADLRGNTGPSGTNSTMPPPGAPPDWKDYSRYGMTQVDVPGVGGFAAANQNYGQAFTAENPYIGRTTQFNPAQANTAVANTAATNNPWLGQTTQQVNYQGAQGSGANPFAGKNPYLDQNINATLSDMSQQFNETAIPALDRMMQASGSFGNTGVQQQQNQAFRDLARQQGNVSSGMRMQDYGMQQQLAENALNRTQGLNQFNASNQLNAALANAGFNAGDLNRNLSAANQLGMFNAGQLNNMGQFNAGQLNNMGQFNTQLGANLSLADIARNAGLAQGLGQFNAAQQQGMSQFNTGQGNQLNLANANAGNNLVENFRNRRQRADEFNQNMDLTAWDRNMNWMNTGQRNTMDFLSQLMGLNATGVTAAGNVQNQPLEYLQAITALANALGGQGGSTNQNLDGSPLLGALGGAQLGELFGSMYGTGP